MNGPARFTALANPPPIDGIFDLIEMVRSHASRPLPKVHRGLQYNRGHIRTEKVSRGSHVICSDPTVGTFEGQLFSRLVTSVASVRTSPPRSVNSLAIASRLSVRRAPSTTAHAITKNRYR